jgi:4-hydroxybutyryl-CoA dehydratase/vinylacetyl-CoA-Delta-isomerase
MAIRTPEQYVDSLKKTKPRVFIGGRKVANILDDANLKVTINAIAKTYAMAYETGYEDIFTATSHLTGEKISRWDHVPHSIDDLEKRRQMNVIMAQKIGTCTARCVGTGVMHTMAAVTHSVDKKYGTEYEKRFNDFLRYIQENDLACNGPMTDAKGDRDKRPSQQEDPDVYLHLVEKRSDGIIVRGAKMHQEGSFACNYHIVVPPIAALRKGEEAFAISFAVPVDAEGLVHIVSYDPFAVERRYAEDIRDLGSPTYGSSLNCMMVFDNVFIPWERVFLCGETEFALDALSKFAKIHNVLCRGSCKVGFMDLIIGAAKMVAEHNGIDKANHVVEKLTEMVRIRETVNSCAIGAYLQGTEDPPGSGIYFPDYVAGVVTAIQTQLELPKLGLLAGDLAGGAVVTLPSLAELRNPETKEYVEKYMKAASDSAEERMRILKFIQHWVAGPQVVKMWHGGGPIQGHYFALGKLAQPGFEEKKKLVKALIGLTD